MSAASGAVAGVLLLILGVWLLLQTLVGNLPTRILSLNPGAKGVAGTAGQDAVAGGQAAIAQLNEPPLTSGTAPGGQRTKPAGS